MSRILIVAEHYLPTVGGGVRYMAVLADHYRQLGHTVDVLTTGYTPRTTYERSKGGTIIRMGEHLKLDSGRLSTAVFPFMFRHLVGYDLVHWNAPSPLGELGFFTMRLLGKRPLRSVCFYHGEVVADKPLGRLYNNWLLAKHFEACDRILVSSPNFAHTSPLLQRVAAKVVVIPFGVDTDLFSPASDWEQAMHHQRPLHFVFVGRLAPQKGLLTMLQALTRAPGTLTIVGDGPLQSDLQAAVGELDLEERVTFAGKITVDCELISLYRQADVVVLPSTTRSESFGYALAEGMACGACAISTELGTGTSFINADGKSGLVVPPGDPDALAEAMIYLAERRGQLVRFRCQARERVERMFSLPRMLAQTDELFETIGVAV